MTKPFQVFTGGDLFDAHKESEDLVIPGETDSWDALAIVLNRRLNGRGAVVRGKWSWTVGGKVGDTHEALLIGQREIGK